jgi:hypothetical protein
VPHPPGRRERRGLAEEDEHGCDLERPPTKAAVIEAAWKGPGLDVYGPGAACGSPSISSEARGDARGVLEGLSNPKIGARLFLSPRTVEWHLHDVFLDDGPRDP